MSIRHTFLLAFGPLLLLTAPVGAQQPPAPHKGLEIIKATCFQCHTDAMWRDHDVRSTYGESAKHVRHPVAGLIALEYSAFAVDGRPDLGMVIYNPATPADAERVRSLMTPPRAKKRATGRHGRR